MAEITTKAELADYIKRRLGFPTLEVELTEEQLDDAISDALRLFNRYMMTLVNKVLWNVSTMPEDEIERLIELKEKTINQVVSIANGLVDVRQDREPFTTEDNKDEIIAYIMDYEPRGTTTGGVVIDLPSNTTGVYYVTFLQAFAARAATRMSVFEMIYRMAYPPIDLGHWYMLRSFYEMYQRVRGSEPDYRYDPTTNKLFLNVWGGPYDIFYVIATDVSVESILTGRKRIWAQDFIDLCVCNAKEMLAQIRGKFGGIPSPGGALSPNADKLASEAAEKKKEIEEKLKKIMRAFYLPQIG